MRNVWAIARKELRNYFDHPTAYILAVVFLVVNFFFFFRTAFLQGNASMRAMFDLLPWFLLFFVPAVTMGSLAEERRGGTLEVLLSHPIQMHDVLLGKYLGNVLFLLIVLLATLTAPLTLSIGGDFDLGVLFAQYFGSVLLVGGMAAVGVFASALTRNQITAFIIGTAVIFVLMLLGSEVIQVGLPAWLTDAMAGLGILNHFYNVTRGVLDLRDMIYFVALGAAFLALAYWLLMRERLSRTSNLYKNLRLGTLAIVAIAVVANLFGRYIPGRIDLTANNLYTVSDGTKQVLDDLDDLVTITLYASSELPAQVKLAERDIEDVLRDFRRYGDGNVQVIRKHPDDSEEARQEAQRLGIQPVQFNVLSKEELQLKNGWLGIAVQYADESEVLPFVGDARNLEYQLATNVWKLTRAETPKVAFITGHGERGQSEFAGFTRELRRTYEVTSIDLSQDTARIPDDMDVLIVAGPRRPVGQRARQLLREFLSDDGRIFFLGSGVNVNLQYLIASEAPDSAVNVVESFGVQLNKNLVYDLRSNEAISVPGQFFNYVVQYPFWVRALPAGEHIITRGINSVFMPWPSSLDTVPSTARRSIPLLTTSRFAGAQRGSFQIRPDQDMAFDESNLKPQMLAVALLPVENAGDDQSSAAGSEPIELGRDVAQADGETAAAAAGPQSATGAEDAAQSTDSAVPEAQPERPMTPVRKSVQQGTLRGRLVVVGDADFLTDQFAQNSVENIVFGLNAINWLTQSDALLSIRSKTPTPRPLLFESEATQTVIKYINLIGVPLAFVLLGVARTMRRRRFKGKQYAT